MIEALFAAKKNDLISRSALIAELEGLKLSLGDIFFRMVVDRAIERVREQPSVCACEDMTNADLVRMMNDRELANFLSAKFADFQVQNAFTEDSPPTATQISALKSTWYAAWMQWLRLPVTEKGGERNERLW
ncbi:MAG: hypothetical protein IJX67_05095 [Oscillospiraceae bacterium]|nr:hypothetical protein [Oscillospiraceae bacterium]